MNDKAGWRAWSGGWRSGEPPADWWLSSDGRWYPPAVQRPPGGPRWRGSAAEFRPREFAEAGAWSPGGVGLVTRARPHTPRHAAAAKSLVSSSATLNTTVLVLVAALVAALALALIS